MYDTAYTNVTEVGIEVAVEKMKGIVIAQLVGSSLGP